jgi:non-ribosomal peptide synthetase component F
MVVNTIPIRADLSGDPTFEALVERVRDAAVETYAHQDVPFAEIVAAVAPRALARAPPALPGGLQLPPRALPRAGLGGATLEVEEGLGNESAKFDLNVIVIPRAHQHAGDEVVMIWEFAEDLFDGDTVRRMIGHYETLLAAALADPAARVSASPRLRGEMRAVLLRGRRTPRRTRATPRCTPLRRAGAARPDAVAVEHGGGSPDLRRAGRGLQPPRAPAAALGAGPEARGVCDGALPELVAASWRR